MKRKASASEKRLNSRKNRAKRILSDENKSKDFINNLQYKKIKSALKKLEQGIALLIDFVKSYLNKQYTKVPVGTMIAIVAALLYWLSPIDAIPDFIPGFGYIDDAGVIAFCINLVRADLEEFKEWRDTVVVEI